MVAPRRNSMRPVDHHGMPLLALMLFPPSSACCERNLGQALAPTDTQFPGMAVASEPGVGWPQPGQPRSYYQ